MELTVKKTDLVKELSLGQGVIERKSTIPVLANVLIEAGAEGISLTVTDLELGIRTSCPATVAHEGTTTIPARRLLDYVRLLPDAELAVKTLENDSISLVCGRPKTRIAGMSRENFPELPKMPPTLTKIPAALLVKAISRTIFAIAGGESRYTLTGSLLLIKEASLVMVTTDGHRLAYVEIDHPFEGINGEWRALLPRKAMAELLKLATEGGDAMTVDFSNDENHLFFQCGQRLLISRKLTGQFPDYERVLPSKASQSVILNREEAAAAIRRVAQFADDRSRAIRLEVKSGELVLSSSASEVGESEESVAVEYSGEPIKIGFNSQYLLDFLGVIDSENVQLQFANEDSAGQLKVEPAEESLDYRYVIMPMRV